MKYLDLVLYETNATVVRWYATYPMIIYSLELTITTGIQTRSVWGKSCPTQISRSCTVLADRFPFCVGHFRHEKKVFGHGRNCIVFAARTEP